MPSDAPPDLTAAPDPLVALAEERLAWVHELAGLGMALTRATVRHAIEAMEAPPVEPADDDAPARAAADRDPADSFAKLSRAVRLTIMLEEKLDLALRARLAGEIAKCEESHTRAKSPGSGADDIDPEAEDPYACLKTGRRGRVRDLVRDVVDHEIGDPEEHDIIIDALDERLLFDEAYAGLDDLPLRETVERLCEDLKFKPDWRRWAGDGWKPDPPFWRPRRSFFRAPSRTSILRDSVDPDSDLLE